jgi:hypothetical protein
VDRTDDQDPATAVAASTRSRSRPRLTPGVKRKPIRGGIALAVLIAVAIGVIGLLPRAIEKR